MVERSYRALPVDTARAPAAVTLLTRFFEEEGFVGSPSTIAAHLEAMLSDPHHWAALALAHDDRPVGVVTVTTMLYVEWGRFGEIGDLYILPEHRRRGVAKALVRAGVDWCRAAGCSAVSVTLTPEGQGLHGLATFYEALGFMATGRTSSVLRLGQRSN